MNLFDLYVELSLDSKGFNSDIDKIENKASSSGNKIASKLGGVVKNVAKVSAAAVAAGATAIIGITKKAVDAYAEYEQLAGGVETLFGDDAAQTVINNAQQAYKTAQLSANDYMDTVTSFSASLIQSLGGDTVAAADKADKAILDMSDNANKMGTDISSIQNAYQGFAKGNYTMLDNLKLGFGGTQSEMERLLVTAEGLTGQHYELGNFADMVDAIHAVQENMGIAGASAEEAATTIEGSINMMKASWQNFLTGLGDPDADIGALADNLIESLEAVANNLGPVVERILTSLVTAIQTKGPAMIQKFTKFIVDMAPDLIKAAVVLITGLIDAIVALVQDPTSMAALMDAIITVLGALVVGLINILDALLGPLWEGFTGALESGWNSISEWFAGIPGKIGDFFSGAGTWLLDAGKSIISGLVDGITSGIDWVADKLSFITDMLPEWKGPPSRDAVLLRGSGALIMQGLMDGIGSETSALQAQLGGITGTIANGIDTDSVTYGDSVGGGLQNSISALSRNKANGPDTITVKSVLDGRVISESSAKYDRQEARAKGV